MNVQKFKKGDTVRLKEDSQAGAFVITKFLEGGSTTQGEGPSAIIDHHENRYLCKKKVDNKEMELPECMLELI